MSTSKKSIAFNYAMNMFLTVGSIIFPLITFPYASRVLGPTGTGSVAFVTSVTSYFTLFSQLGIPIYGVRECSKVRDDKAKLSNVVQELLVISAIATCISCCLLATCVVFVPQFRAYSELFFVLSSSVILGSLGMEWLFKGLEEYAYISLRSLLFKILALLALFVFVHTVNDVLVYAFTTVIASVGSNICNFIRVRKIIDFKLRNKLEIKRHLKPIFLLFAMTAVTTVYTSLNSTLLGLLTSTDEVGFYDVAVKVRALSVSLVTSLSVVMLPRASFYLGKGDHESFLELSKKSSRYNFVFASAIATFILVFAKPIILVIAGEEYYPAIAISRVLACAIIMVALSNVTGTQVLVPLGGERGALLAAVAGAAASLILDLFLIPFLGGLGAAISTLVSEIIVLLVQVLFLNLTGNLSFFKLPIARVLFASALAGLLSSIVLLLGFASIVEIIIGFTAFSSIYIVVLLLLREPTTVNVVQVIYEKLRMICEKAYRNG